MIHGDLKPSNILVDDEGRVRLVDFGIARLYESESTPSDLDEPVHGTRSGHAVLPTRLTGSGPRPHTPLYASPEVVRGGTLDTACDVYSLGIVLHELLTGHTPEPLGHTPADPAARSATATATATDSHSHPDASTGGDDAPAPRLVVPPSLGADLEAILRRALAPRPDHRYDTVTALADDVRRHRDRMPVLARPDPRWDATSKFLRRHAWSAFAATLVIIALVAATLVSLDFAREAEDRSRIAEAAREAEAIAHAQADTLFATLLDRSLETTFRFALDVQALPGAAQVGVRMLADAVTDLEHLVELSEAGDPALQVELARALTRLGDAQGNPAYPNVGDIEAAEASYRRALDLALALDPTVANRADVLALCESRVGEILAARGRADEATVHFERALALRLDHRQAHPADHAARFALALAHDRLGTHLLRTQHVEDALPHLERYLSMVGTLHDDGTTDPLVTLHVGFAYQRLGAATWAVADYEASGRFSLAAARHFEALVEGDPTHVIKRAQAGWSWYWAGNADVQLERWEAAESSLTRAADLYTELLAADPGNAQHAQPLGGVYEMLGNLERSRARETDDADARRAGWRAARRRYEQALELWESRTEPRYAHLPQVMHDRIAECDAAPRPGVSAVDRGVS